MTEKLNPTNMLNMVKNPPKIISSPERINFCPKSISANSGHNAMRNTANKKAKTTKYV
jgi:hypothetical protein